jgi:hypothetical protein
VYSHLNWHCYRSREAALAFVEGFNLADPLPSSSIVHVAEIGGRYIVEVTSAHAHDHRTLDYDYAVGDSGGGMASVPVALIEALGEELAVHYIVWADSDCDFASADDDGVCTIDLARYRERYPHTLALGPENN